MQTKDILETYSWQSGEDDRRAVDRADVLGGSMKVMADHMFKIKRALDAGQVEVASALVNGAIKAFQRQQTPHE